MRNTPAYKKISQFILASLLAVGLAQLCGCGGDGAPTITSTEQAETEAVSRAIEESGADWEAGANSVTALTPEEQDMLNGDVDEAPAGGRVAGRPTAREAAALPAAVDWSLKDGVNWMTSVKDQGSCGSCVAFASLGALESRLRIVNNNQSLDLDLAEADLFDCAGRACTGGWSGIKAAQRLQQDGVVTEACLPYSLQNSALANTCDSKCADWQSQVRTIDSYTYIYSPTDPDTARAQIKTALQDGPVVGSMKVYTDFFYYKSGVYEHVYGDERGGHAVVIAGYNDTGGYWIIRNSWGASWGDSGYAKIKYGEADLEKRVTVVHTVSATQIEPEPEPEAVCGDSTVNGDEECDTGAANGTVCSPEYGGSCTYCSASCQSITLQGGTCGDGAVNGDERCDSGASNGLVCSPEYGGSCTYCSASCQSATVMGPRCGDGNVDADYGEQCDNLMGNGAVCTPDYSTDCTYCTASCQSASVTGPKCGDGNVDAMFLEECDDGNTTPGDACSSTCKEPVLCSSLDVFTCDVTSPCYWDDGSGACLDFCFEVYDNQDACLGDSHCYWDTDVGVCKAD